MLRATAPASNLRDTLASLARAGRWDDLASMLWKRRSYVFKDKRGVERWKNRDEIAVKTYACQNAYSHGQKMPHAVYHGKYLVRVFSVTSDAMTLWKHYASFPLRERAYDIAADTGVRYLVYVFADRTFVLDFNEVNIKTNLVIDDVHGDNTPEVWLPKGRFQIVSQKHIDFLAGGAPRAEMKTNTPVQASLFSLSI